MPLSKQEKIDYWVTVADYDLETAKSLLITKRFLYVGFMCHQSVEKILKAYYCSVKDDAPPFIHNLKQLANMVELLTELSNEQLNTLEELLPLNIQSRYPSHKEAICKSLSVERCNMIILKTENLCQWIKQRL